MVDIAVSLPTKEERQQCANTIIHTMGNMFPHLRDLPDFKKQLWDHLAIMSDFKLDIDYPFEIIKQETLQEKPHRVPYNNTRIMYRHYGRTLETLIRKACEMEDGDEKKNLVALIGNHMKKDFIAWNKDAVDLKKISSDLEELSAGKLQLTDEIMQLMNDRINYFCRPKGSNNNKNKNKNKNKK